MTRAAIGKARRQAAEQSNASPHDKAQRKRARKRARKPAKRKRSRPVAIMVDAGDPFGGDGSALGWLVDD